MREIKFRGKRLDNGEWLYGYLIRLHGIPYIYPDPANNGWNDYEVDPDTVGQFTGLFDKNGKQIYEGDIIASDGWSYARHYVGYRKEEARFVAFVIGTTPQDYCGIFQHWLDDYDKKVIGNIHDNPELLSNDEHDPGTSAH